jgi:hypothetical protein
MLRNLRIALMAITYLSALIAFCAGMGVIIVHILAPPSHLEDLSQWQSHLIISYGLVQFFLGTKYSLYFLLRHSAAKGEAAVVMVVMLNLLGNLAASMLMVSAITIFRQFFGVYMASIQFVGGIAVGTELRSLINKVDAVANAGGYLIGPEEGKLKNDERQYVIGDDGETVEVDRVYDTHEFLTSQGINRD